MSSLASIKIEPSWKEVLQEEFSASYMVELRKFLHEEKAKKKIIYPKGVDIFHAFDLTPLEKVRVVVLGQDPYHGINQAHGLCFSVKHGIQPPPSLLNIYKELERDLGVKPVKHGCLESWAKQGVLLLNSVLTVEHGKAASHQGKGWEKFTDQVVALLNKRPYPIIFVLWGSYAQQKGQVIDIKKHVILSAAHPSPLSAHRGFLGCGHFSKINEYLRRWGEATIDWQLSEVEEKEIV